MEFSLVTNDTPTSVQSTGNSNSAPDWDKINAEKRARQEAAVALLETQNASEVIRGIVCGYVDLGIQERGEYEDVYDPTNSEHATKLENGSFLDERYNSKEKKKVTTLCTPATPAKAYTLVVDFPDYMQDFGDTIGKKPFRMYMGGSFRVKNPDSVDGYKMDIIQRPFYMVENTNNPAKKWALGTTTIPAKMGVAAGIADANGLVTKEQIVQLLGKTFQFEVRVWMKPDKNDPSKTYYTENIKYVGKLPKGMAEVSVEDVSLFGVNFNSPNKPEMLKQVRAIAKNTMKLAKNWEDSVIKKELEGGVSTPNSDTSKQVVEVAVKAPQSKPVESSPAPKVVVPKVAEPVLDSGWDDDSF